MKAHSLPVLVRCVRVLPGIVRSAVSSLVGQRISEACMAFQGSQGIGPTVVLSFDCDFPIDVDALPELSSMLRSKGITGSFAVVGKWVEAFPESHLAVVEGGHELLNHSHTHPNLRNPDYDFSDSEEFTDRVFSELKPHEQLDELRLCHQVVHEKLGVEMNGCRLPHFGNLDAKLAYDLMREVNYRFSSSVLAALSPTLGAPYIPVNNIVEFPVAGCPQHPFTAFDTWHCLVKNGGRHAGIGEFFGLGMAALDSCCRNGGLLNLYFDPKDVAYLDDFSKLLEVLQEKDIRIATYAELLSEFEKTT